MKPSLDSVRPSRFEGASSDPHGKSPRGLELGVPFSRRLREGTRQAHQRAERSQFVQGFLRGVLTVPNYVRMLRDWVEVYAALETAQGRLVNHPQVGWLVFPELFRRAALEADLGYFLGSGWRDRVAPSPAGQAYAGRIATVAAGEPVLLAAHLYTRYLGDLSGGRILGRIAANSLGLREDGLAFYRFPEIADAGVFKMAYRERLDRFAELPESKLGEIIAEANLAFALNVAVFDGLTGNPWRSFWRQWRAFFWPVAVHQVGPGTGSKAAVASVAAH